MTYVGQRGYADIQRGRSSERASGQNRDSLCEDGQIFYRITVHFHWLADNKGIEAQKALGWGVERVGGGWGINHT